MLKPNVTQTDFNREILINNAQGECIANVQCSWSDYHVSIPATFDHADESETESSGLNIEFYSISEDETFEINISNEQIPYAIYWSIVEHIDKYGKEYTVPDLVMSDIEEFWDTSIFPQ
jgi:hypothetical protein